MMGNYGTLQYESKRQQANRMRAQLDAEFQTFVPTWRDCGDFILPYRTRFNTSDSNRGGRKSSKIIDSTATMAANTLRSGMMSGITSPARPWFKLTTPDPDMAKAGNVKTWLYDTTERMNNIFLKSNLYNVLPQIYGDLGGFGTAAMLVEEDMDAVIHCFPFPIGSYKLALDEKLKVDVFQRDFRMSVRQLLGKFGQRTASGGYSWRNFSQTVKDAYDNGQMERLIEVTHQIWPNRDYNPMRPGVSNKKYSSCYYERGSSTGEGGDDVFLREAGFDRFPVLAPRWETTGEDTYSTSWPGIVALGDVKALQLMQKRKAQAIDKMVNPPMKGPSSLRTQKVSTLPGDITYLDTQAGGASLEAIYNINFRIQDLKEDIRETQQRISRAFYEDLFLMLAQSDRRQITAREIDERHEEKLLALGPVLEQLNQDLLDPLIDITFDIMLERGMVPEAPEELHGIQLKVEYISIMAQAQKAIGISTIERGAGFVAQVLQLFPETRAKVNADQMLDIYGERISMPPGIFRTEEEVAAIRQQEAEAAQAQAQAQQVAAQAQAAQTLSKTDTSGDNALTRLMSDANAGSLVQA